MTIHIIKRGDGALIYGEYAFMVCDGPDDWTIADQDEHDEPTEYEIFRCEPIAERTFGGPDEDEDEDEEGDEP